MDIGARLHRVRTAHGLGQRALAKRVGVTNSTISLIEQNKVGPSGGSLRKVLDGIPISLSEFFTRHLDTAAADAPFHRADGLPGVGSAGLYYRLVDQPRPQRRICLLREVMRPDSDTGARMPMLVHDGEQGVVAVAGDVEVSVGGQGRRRRAGEGYYVENRVPHRFHNVGSQTAVLVGAYTPATF